MRVCPRAPHWCFSVLLATVHACRRRHRRRCTFSPLGDALSICTTSQFSQHSPAALKEWLEYHKLLGVDHVYWTDRLKKEQDGRGPNMATLAPYIEQGFVSYDAHVYHKPFDYNVYVDQAYTNTACYMRLRHRSSWIATVDVDELIDVQPPKAGVAAPPRGRDAMATPGHAHPVLELGPTAPLPRFLGALNRNVTEVNLMHCKLLARPGADGKWKGYPRGPSGNLIRPASPQPRLAAQPGVGPSSSGAYRNCRDDVPAGKAIGRALAVPFSHVHFLWPAGYQKPTRKGGAAAARGAGCSWQWHGHAFGDTLEPPASCDIVSDYPQVKMHPATTSLLEEWAGFNHVGGSRFISFKGKRRGVAAPAFTNDALNAELGRRLGLALGEYEA